MTLEVTVSLEGVELMERLFENKENRVYRNQREAVESGCVLVVADAKRICPVETGYLRSNIAYVMDLENNEIKGVVGVNDIVKYAPYIEYGTGGRGGPYPSEAAKFKGEVSIKGQIAQPFLNPSLVKNQLIITKMIAEATVEGLEK